MEQAKFEGMVAQLEEASARAPRWYQFKVALLALLGFALIAVMMGFAGFALLLVAGLAAAMLFTGGKGLILLFKLGKLLIFIAIPCWMLIRSSFSALFARLPAPQGIEIKRQDAPTLFEQIDALRARLKGPRFHHVLVVDEMNAAVMQRPAFGLFGFPRNYLILGMPLLDSLTPAEALSVVAHEYGHLAGSHSAFGAYIYRLRNTWSTLHQLSEQWSGFFGKQLHRLVSWYSPYFNAYTFVLARANEYQADAAAAALVGAPAARAALKRVNLAAAHYDAFLSKTYDDVRKQPVPPDDLATQWAAIAPAAAVESEAQNWLQSALRRSPHFADTHPSLIQRLTALALSKADDSVVHLIGDDLPPVIEGATAAQAWLGEHATKLRNAHQQQWHARMNDSWQQRHAELCAQRERLQALRALVAPTVDEQIEALQLQVSIEPEADNLNALSAFNQANPDRAVTLFLEASLRLDAGDERALDMLERAMALDSEAIKPACERAYAYLRDRDDPRAQTYADRWTQHDNWENERARQINTLDDQHELVDPQLSEDVSSELVALLRANQSGIARAWIARRIIPADGGVLTYVLGVELTAWARFRKHHHKIVDRLCECEWPFHVLVCALDGAYKPLKAALLDVPNTSLPLRS